MNGRGPVSLLRAPAEDEDHGRERWLVSYADFITLLFAFFVVLYSISSVNTGKFRVLSKSISTVFSEDVTRAAPVDLGGGAPPVTGLLDGAPNVAPIDQPGGNSALSATPQPLAPPAAPNCPCRCAA